MNGTATTHSPPLAGSRGWAISLYFVFYNFVRIHTTLKMTPAMKAGVSDRLWSMEDIVGLVDDQEVRRLTARRASLLAQAE